MDKTNWKIFLNKILDLILLIVFILVFPVFAILWLPCVFYRKCVVFIVKVFNLDLQPLNTIGTLFADEKFTKNASSCSIVSVLKFNGNFSVSALKSLVMEKVISAKVTSDSKELKYPEMQKHLVSFMGYPFWKQDSEFHIDNHVNEYESEKEIIVENIHELMINQSFPKHQSPWQMTLFQSEKDKYPTHLALRLHHSMGDGRSVVRLIVEGLGEKVLFTKQATFSEQNFLAKLKYYINLPLGLSRLVLTLIKCRLKITGHPWKQSECVHHAPFYVSFINTVPLERFKKIASLFGISTSSVILTAVSTAIRKFLIKKEHTQINKFPIYLTLPKVNHPVNLTNHLRTGIPCIEYVNDECEFLKRCNETYKVLRNGDHSKHLAVLLGMIVTLPGPLRRYVANMKIVATGISNIAGEQEGFSVESLPCQEFTMSAGILQGSIGVSFTVLSYKNQVKICTVAKSNILSKDDTVTLTALVEKEFISLGLLILA